MNRTVYPPRDTSALRRPSAHDDPRSRRSVGPYRIAARAVVVLAVALVAVPVLAVGGRLVPAIEDAVDARQATAPETARAAREAGVTYDDSDEGGLDPALEHALDHARAAAAAEGIEIVVTSGWRSAAHQQQLFDEAVVRYGSVEEAHKWVLPPDESEHVTGRAVDVGPQAARDWLEAHGARWGLCRVYRNEPWHFERLAPEDGGTCPPMRDNA